MSSGVVARSFHFASKERAIGSPLAERLFGIPTVTSVLISHDRVVVNKAGMEEWPAIGRQIGAAIRAHLATGLPAVSEQLRATIPPAELIRERVQEVLDTQINPAVAAHGGYVGLIDVQDNTVFIQMGGGCQGCGMADVTLKQGIEVDPSVPRSASTTPPERNVLLGLSDAGLRLLTSWNSGRKQTMHCPLTGCGVG
jgi:Fe-S cluster biogenesis protein NfuA